MMAATLGKRMLQVSAEVTELARVPFRSESVQKGGEPVLKAAVSREWRRTEGRLMRCYHPAVAGLAALLGTSSVAAQTSPGPCGEVVTVQRGDTLSRIAERCNVTERSLIRVNPWIDGSHDLRVGMQIRTQGGAGSSGGAVDRLGSLAGEAVDTLSGLARDVGSSAQDLLDKNPDLRQRLDRKSVV